MKTIASVTIAALLLSSCAGRAPNPVAISQPRDATYSCRAIQAEIAANNEKITELGTEQGLKVAQNIVAVGAGLFFILPFFLMDFQDAAGTDKQALEDRNAYLAQLALDRCQVADAAAD
jgi:hypothetical protein